MQDSDTSIDTIFIISGTAIIKCTDLNEQHNNMLEILKVQVVLLSWHCNRIVLEKKVVL